MKNKENKQIAEKLDSLNSLPEGYQPDIDSKWALLEDAMEEKAIIGWRIHLRWLAVAASILLISTLAMWLDGKHHEIKQAIVKNNFTAKSITKQSIFITEDECLSAAKNVQASQMKITFEESSKNRKQIKKGEQILNEINNEDRKKREPLKSVSSRQIAKSDSIPQNYDLVDQVTSSMPEIAMQQVDKKKKKQRYFEMDFSQPTRNTQLPREERMFTQLFRVKIFPDVTDPYTASNSGNNFLRFKKNF
ncbi:MAG: hypothetical protein ABI315_14675 [Bacteroidia bacterium]